METSTNTYVIDELARAVLEAVRKQIKEKGGGENVV